MEVWDGTFALVDPQDIGFDRAKYQRDENWPLISAVASNPSWPAFVVVPCAKREYAGGTLWAYDAQQRLLGVLASADPPKKVPVVWWAVKSRMEEAAIFINVNVNRKSVSPLAKYKAQLGAEHHVYVALSKAVDEAGYTIGVNGETSKAIAAIGGLESIYNAAGVAGVKVALGALDTAWSDEKHATSSRMLNLLAEVLGEMASNGGIKQDKLEAALRKTTPGQLGRKAKDIRYDTDCSTDVAMRRAFKALGKL